LSVDETLFRAELFSGHQALTDIYLAGLAVSHHGSLAITFSVGRPLPSVAAQ
jgi:hypothetical protein